MKQKIVVKVHMSCEKCRTKAMKIAAVESGLSSIAITEEDKLVVVGDEIDSVCLTRSLRKKFPSATLVSVEEVKEEKKKEEPKKKDNKEPAPRIQTISPPAPLCHMTQNPQPVVCFQMVEDPNPDFCSMM